MNAMIQGLKEFNSNLNSIQSRMVIAIKKVVNTQSFLLKTHIAQDDFVQGHRGSYGMDGVLQSRSGQLKRSMAVQPTKVNADSIIGGISFGTRYAKVHIGKRGQSMTMVPKVAKMLAIPLPAAQKNYGEAKGGPRDPIFGETFLAKNKAGNLIIYGKTTYTKGVKAGQTKGNIVPLFILKKSVTVKTRLFTEDMLAWLEMRTIDDLKHINLAKA
jgi:hypothetical protein